jgi:hypothetical protein
VVDNGVVVTGVVVVVAPYKLKNYLFDVVMKISGKACGGGGIIWENGRFPFLVANLLKSLCT